MRARRDWLTQGKQVNNGACQTAKRVLYAADFGVNAQKGVTMVLAP
jgi:hypothetical protein